MAHVKASSQKDVLANMLSADAAVFVPRQLAGGEDCGHDGLMSLTNGVHGAAPPTSGPGVVGVKPPAQQPANGLPTYITTCYPFVAPGEPRFPGVCANIRPKFPGSHVAPPHMQQLVAGLPPNRFPQPGKLSSMVPGQWGASMGTSVSAGYPPFASLPNGLPFDGGTYPPNGFIRPPHFPPPAVQESKSVIQPRKPLYAPPGPHGDYKPINGLVQPVSHPHLINGLVEPVSHPHLSAPAQYSQGAISTETSCGHRTEASCGDAACLRFKTSAIQTDFPASLANSTLEDVPNTLYGTHHRHRRHRPRSRHKPTPATAAVTPATAGHGSDSDVDTDSGYSSALHRHDQVHSGTNPSILGPPDSLPGPLPAHNHVVNYVNNHINTMQLIAVSISQLTCESRLSYASVAQNHPSQNTVSSKATGEATSCDRDRKVKCNTSRNFSGVNVNVASIMQDLENAQERQEQESWGKVRQTNVAVVESQGACDSRQCEAVAQCSAGPTLDGSTPPVIAADGTQDGVVVKKKRKRTRRRRKKSGGGGEGGTPGASGGGDGDDVELHFEDEEEFPDLAGAAGDTQRPGAATTPAASYSDILKHSSMQPAQPPPVTVDALPAPQDHAAVPPAKESRSSRKRRKRQESANKAAEVEMAEIGLEQHMLEMKMKQKQPLTAKKSVSPIRNPSQGVWKLPTTSPSTQPSSSGKKVSLLLPATVATEPTTITAVQPPSVAKQPGILKPTQQPSESGGGKKSKQPIAIDFGAMIDALEAKKAQQASMEASPGREGKHTPVRKEEPKSLNALDSTAPAVRRGKERETPKTKKPSPLKKVILKEREEKKRLRMLDEDDPNNGVSIPFPTTPISAPVGIGVVSGMESDLSQDASSSRDSMEVGLGTPASAELSPISQPSPICMSPLSPGASPLSSGVNSPIASQNHVKLKIHSRRFREYCNQVLDKEIDSCCTALLTDLVRFQDRQYHKDPIKAKARRRFVLGLREVTKHLKLKKVKCVIISPNLEKIQSKGGLDDALNKILDLCNDQNVPFIFALGRRALGRACAKLVPVSVVGIFNYDGSEENFRALVGLTEKARDQYREMIGQIEKELAEQPPRLPTPGLPHIFAHMGHSRTPSGCSMISFTSSILSEPISENYPYSEPETDNRGYEIVRSTDSGDGSRTARDPYEADDESGSASSKHVSSKDQPPAPGVSQPTPPASVEVTLEPAVHGDAATVCGARPATAVDGGKQECVTPVIGNQDSPTGSASSSRASSDGEDGSEDGEDGSQSSGDTCDSAEGTDTVEELPTMYIDSIHRHAAESFSDILSQHSSKTMENAEDVMSTHSSKTTHSSHTINDGSTIHGADKSGGKVKLCDAVAVAIKGKPVSIDKDARTLSWVREAQHHNFHGGSEVGESVEENGLDVGRGAIDLDDLT